jgi:nucleoside-diphosphate-sugar epimerase
MLDVLAQDVGEVDGFLHPSMFPDRFRDETHLEDFMSTPTRELVNDLDSVPGDIIILGVAGKIGVTLARTIKRAAPGRRVIGVARFSEAALRERLQSWGIETIACDLLDRSGVSALPKVPNVIYMAGLKFDYKGREDFLWAMNVLAPAFVAEAFSGSRIVAFSTIHVYPWSNPLHGGMTEFTPPLARPGEYGNSVVGRERVFQYHTKSTGSLGRIARLAYAIDMRYGVLQEIGSWVRDGQDVPLATGQVNVIWQGDAINQIVRLLGHCDTACSPINIGGPESVSVRKIATDFGRIFGVQPKLIGAEGECLLANCDRAAELLGNPTVPVSTMVRWVADWLKQKKPTYGKPSKFEVRSGVF